MQISNIGGVSGTQNVKKKAGSAQGNFADFLNVEEEAEVSKTSATTNLSALNVLNEVGEEDENKKKKRAAVDFGNDLLDELDAIKNALVMGGLTTEQLMRIQKKLAAHKSEFIDPKLDFLINEIEVRAAVELAKLGVF